MIYICEHGHAFDEEALLADGVPFVVIDEARKHHELGLCVQLDTDNMLQGLMKQARELWPDKYPTK